MRLRPYWLILAIILAACSASPQRELPTYVPWPADLTATVQEVAMNDLIAPATVAFDEVIAPATFAATSQSSYSNLTLPPTFTSTLIPTLSLSPSAIPSATAINTITPSPTSIPTLEATTFPEREEADYSSITYEEARALLLETPLMSIPEEYVRQIYARGQARGLNQDFLLSVGDCNTESEWYLQSLLDDKPPQGEGVNISYFQDSDVQTTIDYYRDAFAFKGQSVNSGLNAMSVMDPFWANPNLCASGASPLACDFQQTQPFAALIMFGANDILVLNTAGYEMAMREIIELTLERDIIPILSTFTVRPTDDGTFEQGVRFNAVVIKLAEEYNIPLINFWLAAREIGDYGILLDNAHMTVPGFNIRNRLTLDMLTTLRQDVLAFGDET
jgi:GDSL-like lipase/acylhydrolase family protein